VRGMQQARYPGPEGPGLRSPKHRSSVTVFDGLTKLGCHEFSESTDLGDSVESLAGSAWPDCTEDRHDTLVVDIDKGWAEGE